MWSVEGPVLELGVEPLWRSQSKSSLFGTLSQVHISFSKLQSPGGGHELSSNSTSSMAMSPS